MTRLVCSLLLYGLTLGCRADSAVAHHQAEREANRMLVLLRQAGLAARKTKSEGTRALRFDVRVPADVEGEALAVLETHDLPRAAVFGTREALGEGGVIPTPLQERARQVVGLEGDIVNALRAIPRVVEAKVAVGLPPDGLFREPDRPAPDPRASVLMIHLGPEPPVEVGDVQRFVQAKLQDVDPEDVHVTLLSARPVRIEAEASAGPSPAGPPPVGPPPVGPPPVGPPPDEPGRIEAPPRALAGVGARFTWAGAGLAAALAALAGRRSLRGREGSAEPETVADGR